MNKLKKLGLTALGTSLVASSAIAADASLTGNVGYTYSSEEVGNSTIDGIGYEADFNMVVSGEMDNGWTWSYSTELDPADGGTATNDEIKELNDEGIITETIPWIEDKNN